MKQRAENAKAAKEEENNSTYAFVCFKNPEGASRAKAELNQFDFNGKHLYINHYEIKEIRKAQYEESHDNEDYNNYKKQNTNISADMMNRPEILAILTQLISLMQPKLQYR